jgi:peptide/nickel transport system substrate-binding protein
MSGQANVLDGPVPSFSPYYDPHTHAYPYDPGKARALLDAAGWHVHDGRRMKDGQVMRITLKTGGATDAVAGNVAQLVQADLAAVGIECTLQNEELQTFFSDYHATHFQLALQGVILPPYTDDYKYYDSKEVPSVGGNNFGFYSNPQLDRAMEAARVARSQAQARAQLDRYQELSSQDVPVIFLYSMRLGAVVPANLVGYDLYPLAPAALPTGLQFWRLGGSASSP